MEKTVAELEAAVLFWMQHCDQVRAGNIGGLRATSPACLHAQLERLALIRTQPLSESIENLMATNEATRVRLAAVRSMTATARR